MFTGTPQEIALMRREIIAAACSWIGTPFHHCADVRGAGVDCAMLLVRVYVDLELVPQFDPRPYSPQWFLHSSESMYRKWLESCAREVTIALPGDIALFKFGKHAAHAAIILDERSMLHAYLPAGEVKRDDRGYLEHLRDSYWSVFA